MTFCMGDRVMLKEGLDDGVEYGSMDYWDDEYEKYLGKVLTVEEVDSRDHSLTVEDDDEGTWFSFEMLDKLEESSFFKVGMRVRIIKDLDISKRYLGQSVVTEMMEHRGGIYTIIDVQYIGGVPNYKLEGATVCYWTSPMFELVDLGYDGYGEADDDEEWVPFLGNPLKVNVGDKVAIKKGLVPNQRYGGVYYPDQMQRDLKGKVMTVSKVDHIGHFYVEGNSYSFSKEMVDIVVRIGKRKEEGNKDMMELIKWLKKEFKKDSDSVTFENLDDFAYYGGMEYVYEKILKKLGGKK